MKPVFTQQTSTEHLLCRGPGTGAVKRTVRRVPCLRGAGKRAASGPVLWGFLWPAQCHLLSSTFWGQPASSHKLHLCVLLPYFASWSLSLPGITHATYHGLWHTVGAQQTLVNKCTHKNGGLEVETDVRTGNHGGYTSKGLLERYQLFKWLLLLN